MNYYKYYPNELCHFGIKGQKWGLRRYQNEDGSYTSQGQAENNGHGRYSSANSDTKISSRSQFKLSDKQKKYLKIGAAVAGTVLVAYGAYKVGQNANIIKAKINLGRDNLNWLRSKDDTFLMKYGNIKLLELKEQSDSFEKLPSPESIKDVTLNSNPLRGTEEGLNNCVPSAIAGFERLKGNNVTAKSTNGEMLNLAGTIERCYKNPRIIDGSASTFGKSADAASSMLVRKFGNNADGFIGITWKKGSYLGNGGHAFSFKITDGNVTFFDCNGHYDDNTIRKVYFNEIDTNGSLTLARVDNCEPIYDELKKYIG